MSTTIFASAQSFLTNINWWDSAFKVGLILAIVFGLFIGHGIMGKIGGATTFAVLWVVIYLPVMFVGSLWGHAAETYVNKQPASSVSSTYSSEHTPLSP